MSTGYSNLYSTSRSNQEGGGTNGPQQIEMIISLELIVQLTSNQAVYVSKFVRCPKVYIKILNNLDLEGTQKGLLSARVPKNQPRRVVTNHSEGLENV